MKIPSKEVIFIHAFKGMMKTNAWTVRRVAVLVGVLSGALDVLAAILYGAPWWAWILSGGLTFGLTYFITRYLLHQYVVHRIKPLYQLLLSKDIATSRLSRALREKVKDDVVDDLQESLDQLVSFDENEIERLVRREQERSEFLAGIAQEIENPVSNIRNYLQVLLDGALEDPEKRHRFIERIQRSADRLLTQIEDVRKLISYESGGAVMTKDTFDLTELVHEVFDTNILNAQENGIKLKLHSGNFPANQPIPVYADFYRIGVVLDNLILNAIQFNKQNGSIAVSFVDMFDKVLVEVSDTGIGIPPRHLPKIFDRLYKVDRKHSPKGSRSGLGLAVVKLILDTHGENITVRSEVGKGSTFSFTLSKPSTGE